jgi:hypothetical protein
MVLGSAGWSFELEGFGDVGNLVKSIDCNNLALKARHGSSTTYSEKPPS